MLVAYCRLCCHCRNLAEGGCLLSWFHFMRCRYFLGHVACRNLPWQGLYVASFVWTPTKNEWFENSKFSGEVLPLKPPHPPKKGDQRPLVDTVGYSIQTCWLLQLLLKPLPSLELFILFKQMNCLLNRNKSPQNISISVSPFGLKWKISLPSTS